MSAGATRARARRPQRTARPARGAAVLVAMVLLTVVATLAAGMVWQQFRAVQVEAAERGRAQIVWILHGAIDWARLILRSDASAATTHLAQSWATPLQEARLSTFLAADAGAAGDSGADAGMDAFLGGAIVDAQARYNLRNLLAADAAVQAEELAVLERLCGHVGVASEVAGRIARGLRAAAAADTDDAPLMPARVDDLSWLGVEPQDIEALRPWVAWLPVTGKPVNLNTAPREVLAAVIAGIDLSGADRLVQARRSQPFKTLEAAREHLPPGIVLPEQRLGVKSDFFEVRGRMRLDDRVIEEVALLERQGREVHTRQRARHHGVLPTPP